MSAHSKMASCRVVAMRLSVIAALCSVGTLLAAQDQGNDRPAPKWELFGGYSFVYPGAHVHGLLPGGLLPVDSLLESNPRGAGASITYNFNRWIGLTGDASADFSSGETGIAKRVDDAELFNFSGGPKITFRTRHFSPFLEVLVGEHRLASELFRSDYEIGFMAGGGLDLNLNRHWALRLIRADYVYSNHQFGPSSLVPATDIRGARLQSGLVFMWGGKNAVVIPPSAACSVQPGEVLAGETVTATASGSNFTSNREVRYSWSGSGIKPGESHATAQIDTSGLQAGSYQVTASLSNGTSSGIASCTARFTVKEPRPPVISCSADSASVPMGGSSTITTTATSPDGRVLTYRYTTSGGNISGNTSTAVLQTTGAQPGPITVTCTVADDRLQPLTASSTTTVNLQAPPPPPDVTAIEKRLALHSVYFATAKPSVEKPDGGLLPSQEKTLTALASDFKIYLESKPDARLTLEGHADPRGSVEYNQALSQRRVERAKGFLVALGIPDANIETKAFGEQENLTDSQVRDAVERNPELSPVDRQRVLKHMRMIILASNRRVDITLTNAGQTSQQSVREYPFNAADSLTLLQEEGTKKSTGGAVHARTKPAGHP
jgi:outer membrane protein OmpA-like peptidoglycan-associated protein